MKVRNLMILALLPLALQACSGEQPLDTTVNADKNQQPTPADPAGGNNNGLQNPTTPAVYNTPPEGGTVKPATVAATDEAVEPAFDSALETVSLEIATGGNKNMGTDSRIRFAFCKSPDSVDRANCLTLNINGIASDQTLEKSTHQIFRFADPIQFPNVKDLSTFKYLRVANLTRAQGGWDSDDWFIEGLKVSIKLQGKSAQTIYTNPCFLTWINKGKEKVLARKDTAVCFSEQVDTSDSDAFTTKDVVAQFYGDLPSAGDLAQYGLSIDSHSHITTRLSLSNSLSDTPAQVAGFPPVLVDSRFHFSATLPISGEFPIGLRLTLDGTNGLKLAKFSTVTFRPDLIATVARPDSSNCMALSYNRAFWLDDTENGAGLSFPIDPEQYLLFKSPQANTSAKTLCDRVKNFTLPSVL